jgi:hypothetical protein
MTKRHIYTAALAIIVFPFLRAVPVYAHGDRIVPHVVNGLLGDQRLRTKLDITNLGPEASTPITKVTVYFRKTDGTPWTLDTDQGTVSQLTLNLGASQTMRITTLGNGSYAHGYVVVRNLEGNTAYSEDYEVAISVYYEVVVGTNIIETVSVPLGQPTVTWAFPVEIDSSKNLGTGFAIADLSGSSNTVSLQLLRATTPSLGNASSAGSISIVLKGNEKKAKMLTESDLFPSVTSFRGTLFGQSTGPVSILGLLVTPVVGGFQYATMAPAYLDALRKNTMTYLPQGYALDADLGIVDYLHNENDSMDLDIEMPWDVLLQTATSDTTGATRSLVPQSGATLCPIGVYDGSQFDGITQETLRGLAYTSNSIDLSDGNANLAVGFTFAIKTGLGRYVKVRIRDYVGYSSSSYQDLMLEIFTYK